MVDKRKQNGSSYEKGEKFQNYIEALFPNNEFILKRRTHSVSTIQKRFVEDSLDPDFTFEHRKTGYRFSVECKWRAKFREDNKIYVAKRRHLDHYEKFEENNHDVYIALGVGGKPDNPKNLFLIPLKDIYRCYSKMRFLLEYSRPTEYNFVVDKEGLK